MYRVLNVLSGGEYRGLSRSVESPKSAQFLVNVGLSNRISSWLLLSTHVTHAKGEFAQISAGLTPQVRNVS